MKSNLFKISLIAALFVSFATFTACKQKPALKPSPLCIKSQQHIMKIAQAQLKAIPAKGKLTPKQAKQKAYLEKLVKKFSNKAYRQNLILLCSRQKHKTEGHKCTLKAKTIEEARNCYRPKKKAKAPAARKPAAAPKAPASRKPAAAPKAPAARKPAAAPKAPAARQ